MSHVLHKYSNDLGLNLSEKQKQCLRLVLRHKTSKEIAIAIGISSHAVDMRIRTAMAALGVNSRLEAAQILHRLENVGIDSRSVYEPPDIDHASIACDIQGHGFGRSSDNIGHFAQSIQNHDDCSRCANNSNLSDTAFSKSDFWDVFFFTRANRTHYGRDHLLIYRRILLIFAIVVISLIAFSSFIFAMQLFANWE